MAFRSEIRSLFRSLHRTARQFPDCNVRDYIKRRTADEFHLNRDASDAAAVFADGKAQLEVAKRKAVVYSLYAPKVRSIMELRRRIDRHYYAAAGVNNLQSLNSIAFTSVVIEVEAAPMEIVVN